MLTEYQMVVQLFLASAVGALLGWERERRGKPAGIRTHILVASAACIFTLIGIYLEPNAPTRVAANVVVGIGFLGAGLIIRDHGTVHGLTTAASIWATAAIGTTIGAGLTTLGVAAAAVAFLVPFIPHVHPDHAEPAPYRHQKRK